MLITNLSFENIHNDINIRRLIDYLNKACLRISFGNLVIMMSNPNFLTQQTSWSNWIENIRIVSLKPLLESRWSFRLVFWALVIDLILLVTDMQKEWFRFCSTWINPPKSVTNCAWSSKYHHQYKKCPISNETWVLKFDH